MREVEEFAVVRQLGEFLELSRVGPLVRVQILIVDTVERHRQHKLFIFNYVPAAPLLHGSFQQLLYMVAEVSCNLTPRHPPSRVLDYLPRYGS